MQIPLMQPQTLSHQWWEPHIEGLTKTYVNYFHPINHAWIEKAFKTKYNFTYNYVKFQSARNEKW